MQCVAECTVVRNQTASHKQTNQSNQLGIYFFVFGSINRSARERECTHVSVRHSQNKAPVVKTTEGISQAPVGKLELILSVCMTRVLSYSIGAQLF